VTVLGGLLECEGRRTLRGIVSTMTQPPTVSGWSRFLSNAPWVAEALVVNWLEQCRAEMQPMVEAQRDRKFPCPKVLKKNTDLFLNYSFEVLCFRCHTQY